MKKTEKALIKEIGDAYREMASEFNKLINETESRKERWNRLTELAGKGDFI